MTAMMEHLCASHRLFCVDVTLGIEGDDTSAYYTEPAISIIDMNSFKH